MTSKVRITITYIRPNLCGAYHTFSLHKHLHLQLIIKMNENFYYSINRNNIFINHPLSGELHFLHRLYQHFIARLYRIKRS